MIDRPALHAPSTRDDEWVLHTTERLPRLRGYLGNGRLAVQVVAEGALAGAHGAPLHLMAELYDRAAEREVEHPAPLPSWTGLHLSLDGAPLRPDTADGYRQSLDLRRGTVETLHRWGSLGIEAFTVQAVLRQAPSIALVTLMVGADRPCTLAVTAACTLPAIVALHEPEGSAAEGRLRFAARTLQRDIPIAIAGALFEGDRAAEARGAELVLDLPLEPGTPRTVSWLVAAHSAYSAGDPRVEAARDLARAIADGPAHLLADHAAAWERLWAVDVAVEGDPEVQRFVRAGLFSLLCSLREDVPASIAPMGLSSLGYNGHIFWDADTWIYPPLLLLHPDLAAGMLTYRQRRLPAALARARAEGYQGAMFPWESATDGDEQTPSFARTGLKEHHITACVALAHQQYYRATGDRAWLAERAWPVLEAAARFWVSRVVEGPDGYEIHDVICADEYAEDVDNNAFTNAAARAALLAAVDAALDLGHTAPPEWRRVADGLVIRRDGDLVLEYDGYDGRAIKQADVELLTFPLEHPLEAGSILRNLDTYRRVTDPDGPAMGKCISSIVAAQLGRREEALALFRGCYEPNRSGPFYALAETPTNGAVNFLTGVGGALQALLFGFGGLRLHDGVLAVDPLLPRAWTALRFSRIAWRGRSLSLAILPGDVAEIGLDADRDLRLILQRWRPGADPLVVALRGGLGLECTLMAEDWRVEPRVDAAPTWWLWPPAGGPARPFIRLHLSAQRPHGEPIVFELEQRVLDGDLPG